MNAVGYARGTPEERAHQAGRLRSNADRLGLTVEIVDDKDYALHSTSHEIPLLIVSFDRLTRSTEELVGILESRRVHVIEPYLDSHTPTGQAFLQGLKQLTTPEPNPPQVVLEDFPDRFMSTRVYRRTDGKIGVWMEKGCNPSKDVVFDADTLWKLVKAVEDFGRKEHRRVV